ncbi:hypothetical protein ACS0TY_018765 [Phlomoides rotata]
MTVAEYERKFSDLSRFAHHLVDTELKKSRRFRNGLRPEIRNVLSGQGLATLAETYERAEEVAASLEMDVPKQREEQNSWKRKWEEPNSKDQNKSSRTQGSGEQTSQGEASDKPMCTTCGKNHRGECLKGQGKCFKCRQPGHQAHNCPDSS